MNWPAYAKYNETAGSDPVPDHWKVSKLRHLLKVNPSVPESLRSDMNEMVTFLPMEAVGENGILDTTRERPVRELLTGYSYFANGDVIMAKVTPCFENGKTALIETLPTTDGFGTSEVTTLRPASGLDQRFLGYFVRSDRFRQSSIAAMTGAGGLKRVPDEHVRSFEIGLPSDTEQCGIVLFLDRETAKIDVLVSKQEQLISTLREDRAATITQAVTKGLDPNVDMKPSTLPGLDEIPHHWQVVPLKHVVRNVGVGLVINPSSYVADSGVPFLLGRNIRDGWIDLTDVNYMSEEDSHRLKASRLKAGDVVVVRAGYPGRAAVVSDELEGANCASILILREPTLTQPEFLASFLNSSLGRAQVKLAQYGAAQEQINVGDVVNFVMPVPPLSEQQEISERVSLQTAAIDALITKSTKTIETLREYRSALITDAVTGKIDVRGVA